MPDPIRMLHFADVHVGMENYGRLDPATGTSSRVRDFLDRLDEVIDHALENQADLAVFAGDAFKNRDPEPTQQREFAHRIKRLADAMPTLLLVGNHDMPAMVSRASSVDIFDALEVPGVIVGRKPDGCVVKTSRGPVYLAWMPYPLRNRLLARQENQGKSIEELQAALREKVADILADLVSKAASHDMPRVLVGHFSVAEAKFGSERTVMLGKDVAVFRSTLSDPTWDYIALGHIHKHQEINQGDYPPIVYSGSLERIDFGEEREEKGFCWVHLTRGETTWEFVPVAARRFQTVDVDVRGDESPTNAVVAELKKVEAEGAVVRVRVNLRADQQAALRERDIQKALEDAASITIAQEVEVEARARLGDLSPESLTPMELVERYFETRNEEPERIQALLTKAEELLRDTG
ncbi:MAG: exonuclease SbcCD subunit D [Anaerolineales bacterium]|jgi:exonuclease SbcD